MLMLILGLFVIVWLFSLVLPAAVDWSWVFRPASLAMLNGESPFSIEGFFNAPWTPLLLLPIAVLPDKIGRAALLVVSLISLAIVGKKMGGNRINDHVVAFVSARNACFAQWEYRLVGYDWLYTAPTDWAVLHFD